MSRNPLPEPQRINDQDNIPAGFTIYFLPRQQRYAVYCPRGIWLGDWVEFRLALGACTDFMRIYPEAFPCS